MKRVLTIQDLSCLGKCSATVALPIISAMNTEAVLLPTAVLSTHTAFEKPVIKGLDDILMPVCQHWAGENVKFDSIYTGYLASKNELGLVGQAIDLLKTEETRVIIDPVMADNGKLYSGFDNSFVEAMKSFVAKADVILPNLTEAALLTGRPFLTEYSENDIKALLLELSKLGCPTVIITGISLSSGQTGAYAYSQGEFISYQTELVPESFHGTGDIFASVFTAAHVNGYTLFDSIKLAADFTSESIRKTLSENRPKRFGVNFESALPLLLSFTKSCV